MWLAALVEDAGATAAFVSSYDGRVLSARGGMETAIVPLPTPEQMLTGPKILNAESGEERLIVATAGADLLLVGVFPKKTKDELMLAAIAALTRPGPR